MPDLYSTGAAATLHLYDEMQFSRKSDVRGLPDWLSYKAHKKLILYDTIKKFLFPCVRLGSNLVRLIVSHAPTFHSCEGFIKQNYWLSQFKLVSIKICIYLIKYLGNCTLNTKLTKFMIFKIWQIFRLQNIFNQVYLTAIWPLY